MSDLVHLRAWQKTAFELFERSTTPDFLAVATPGAGKTTFALTCARAHLAGAVAASRSVTDTSARRPHVVVVAPTSHLKLQWARAAHRLGLELDHSWNPADGLAPDVHGLVTTYQQVATGDTATKLRRLATDGFVILDEVHHAGDERAWGASVSKACATAARRLSLSGTPFRSDANPIPFVRYAETAAGTEAQPDFDYGYAAALRDGGVVRPVYFPRFDGLMEWSAPDGTLQSATFHDELDRIGVAHRLRSALSLDGEWLPAVLQQANDRLIRLRGEQPDAGGLVIATDQEHARGIANMIRSRFGQHAEVVVSDDPEASRKIATYAGGATPWLIAVRMVSEGVDIPRLRVGVYATTVATELFFRQAVGRLVRWQHGRASQKAYMFVPDDPRLRAHAFQIADARRHVLRPPADAEADDDLGTLDQDLADIAAALEPAEQLSLFSVLSSVATGMSVHAITEAGLTLFDDEPDVPEPDDDADPELGGALDVELADVPTAAGYVRTDGRSVAERKEALRTRNFDVARALVDRTGWGHARVNGELNRMGNVNSVGAATNDQLERRLRRAEEWLRRTATGTGGTRGQHGADDRAGGTGGTGRL